MKMQKREDNHRTGSGKASNHFN